MESAAGETMEVINEHVNVDATVHTVAYCMLEYILQCMLHTMPPIAAELSGTLGLSDTTLANSNKQSCLMLPGLSSITNVS